MNLYQLLPETHIKAGLTRKTKFQVIEELLDLLVLGGEIQDRETTLSDVLNREAYLSTGLESGLAIPHAKTDGVDKLTIAFGTIPEGIEFDALDGKPANLIFLVLSPRDRSGPHIQALAAISRNLKEARIRQSLLNAASAEEITRIFRSDFKN
jgi:fructose-specific phosphotransferase system IIA component